MITRRAVGSMLVGTGAGLLSYPYFALGSVVGFLVAVGFMLMTETDR